MIELPRPRTVKARRSAAARSIPALVAGGCALVQKGTAVDAPSGDLADLDQLSESRPAPEQARQPLRHPCPTTMAATTRQLAPASTMRSGVVCARWRVVTICAKVTEHLESATANAPRLP